MDPVVCALLESLWQTMGIDPSAVHPDECVVKDLKMSQNDIEKFAAGICREMRLDSKLVFDVTDGLSLRQVSDIVRSVLADREKVAA